MKQIIESICNLSSIKYVVYLLLTFTLFSCDSIDEDLPPCKVYVQFDYSYNMVYVDLFSAQVENVDLFIFDKEGNFIERKSESGSILKSGNYKMELDLPNGEYQLLTWAGLSDNYELTDMVVGKTNIKDVTLKLRTSSNDVSDSKLSSLWHGEVKNIVIDGYSQNILIPLIRDTNKIRFVLHFTGEPTISDEDCLFKITAENGYYDWNNNILPDKMITYEPYQLENDTLNSLTDIVREIDIMRLIDSTTKKYKVTLSRKSDGKLLLTQDLIHLINLLKMQYYEMSLQEYLDRQYDFGFVFVYDNAKDAFIGINVEMNTFTYWVQLIEF